MRPCRRSTHAGSEDGAGAEERALQVHADDAVEVRIGRRGQRGPVDGAGGVDQQLDGTQIRRSVSCTSSAT